MSQAVLDDGDTFLYLGALLLSTLILIIFFRRYSILAKMRSRNDVYDRFFPPISR